MLSHYYSVLSHCYLIFLLNCNIKTPYYAYVSLLQSKIILRCYNTKAVLLNYNSIPVTSSSYNVILYFIMLSYCYAFHIIIVPPCYIFILLLCCTITLQCCINIYILHILAILCCVIFLLLCHIVLMYLIIYFYCMLMSYSFTILFQHIVRITALYQWIVFHIIVVEMLWCIITLDVILHIVPEYLNVMSYCNLHLHGTINTPYWQFTSLLSYTIRMLS